MKSLSFIFSFALVSTSIQVFGSADGVTTDRNPDASAPAIAQASPAADSTDGNDAAKQEEISRQEKQRFEGLTAAVAANNRGVMLWKAVLSERDKKWNQEVVRASLTCANLAAQFLARFPGSRQAAEASDIEAQMLLKAEAAGSSEAGGRLDALVAKKLEVRGLNDDERFKLRGLQVESAEARLNGKSAVEQSAEGERHARQLIQEFPNRSEPYFYMLHAADQMDSAKRRALVEEVLRMPAASEEVKGQAESLLRFINLTGHPADIQFTALDGREVDLANFKGKVVLVDFWATWCGPCVAELPHVKEAYDKLHSRGFEVVGVSFDNNKSTLEKFVKVKDLPWPQYFDGKGWQNKFGQRYAITSIPAMWLLDKNGNVADTEARDGLERKIEWLLVGKETSSPAQ